MRQVTPSSWKTLEYTHTQVKANLFANAFVFLKSRIHLQSFPTNFLVIKAEPGNPTRILTAVCCNQCVQWALSEQTPQKGHVFAVDVWMYPNKIKIVMASKWFLCFVLFFFSVKTSQDAYWYCQRITHTEIWFNSDYCDPARSGCYWLFNIC